MGLQTIHHPKKSMHILTHTHTHKSIDVQIYYILATHQQYISYLSAISRQCVIYILCLRPELIDLDLVYILNYSLK